MAAEINNTILIEDANLKAYYRFESGALTTDSTGNGNTLTNVDSVAEGTGNFGGCANLGNSNSSKYFYREGNLGITDKSLSISLWVKLNTEISSGYYGFAYLGQTTTDNAVEIRYDYNSGTRRLWFAGTQPGSGYSNIYYNITLGTSNWYHLVLTADGTNIYAYVNGAYVGTVAFPANGTNIANYFVLGAADNTLESISSHSSILLDDVAVFDDALTSDEVYGIYTGGINALELNSTSLVNDSHLKAYYRFESGALTTDSSGEGHTLTAISDPAEDSSGKFGGGVALDGNDAYSATDHADFKPTGNFTIGAWVKTGATAVVEYFFQTFSYIDDDYAGIRFRINADDTVTFESGKDTGNVANTDFKTVTSTSTVTNSTWRFVVGTWDGSYLRLFIDGVQEGGDVAWANAPAYNATNYVRFGCYCGSGTNADFFTGSLDDVFLFNGLALSADDIQSIYDGTINSPSSSLSVSTSLSSSISSSPSSSISSSPSTSESSSISSSPSSSISESISSSVSESVSPSISESPSPSSSESSSPSSSLSVSSSESSSVSSSPSPSSSISDSASSSVSSSESTSISSSPSPSTSVSSSVSTSPSTSPSSSISNSPSSSVSSSASSSPSSSVSSSLSSSVSSSISTSPSPTGSSPSTSVSSSVSSSLSSSKSSSPSTSPSPSAQSHYRSIGKPTGTYRNINKPL